MLAIKQLSKREAVDDDAVEVEGFCSDRTETGIRTEKMRQPSFLSENEQARTDRKTQKTLKLRLINKYILT